MRGKVIYSKTQNVFVQTDKNFQVCDFRVFNKKAPIEERIGERIPEGAALLNTFRGRPLYTAWSALIDIFTKEDRKEENNG